MPARNTVCGDGPMAWQRVAVAQESPAPKSEFGARPALRLRAVPMPRIGGAPKPRAVARIAKRVESGSAGRSPPIARGLLRSAAARAELLLDVRPKQREAMCWASPRRTGAASSAAVSDATARGVRYWTTRTKPLCCESVDGPADQPMILSVQPTAGAARWNASGVQRAKQPDEQRRRFSHSFF